MGEVFHFSAGFFWCKKRTPGRGPWGLTVKRMGASASTDVPGQQACGAKLARNFGKETPKWGTKKLPLKGCP